MYSFFERLVDPFPEGTLKTPPKTVFQFCLFYCQGIKKYLVAMGILTATIALLEVWLFGFLGQLVDILNQTSPELLYSQYSSSLILMALVVLVALPIAVALHSLIMHQTLLGNFPMRVRWLGHQLLLNQSIEFYQNEFAGRISTKLMQTSLAVRESVMKLLDVLLYVGVYFTGILLLVAMLDWRLVIPFVLWFFAYVGLLRYYLPKLLEISAKQAHARSDMTGRIVDAYTNITTIKLFSESQRESDYAKTGMIGFLKTVHPQMRLATGLNVLLWLINSLLTFSVAGLSIWLWSFNFITAGAIAAAIGLILRLFGMSQWIMWEISSLFENIGTVRDGMNTLTQPRKVQDQTASEEFNTSQVMNIQFDNMSFKYNEQNRVFDQFNLTIKAGEKIGLVGRSGAGKSTLVNLLLRFYDIDGGRILIGKQDILTIKQDSLRARIGMVTQDTSLLHRSVEDNLKFGRPSATDEEMIKAAKLAKAHDFIMGLSDGQGRQGYSAHVGERGVKLSGGQRQRIAIARVLLKNAPILILDEATSALDSEVESAIQENLAQLMQGKTVIAIAHRLSTIAAMDRLVVMDEGEVVESGTHQELLTQNGIYANLWARQSGGFIAE